MWAEIKAGRPTAREGPEVRMDSRPAREDIQLELHGPNIDVCFARLCVYTSGQLSLRNPQHGSKWLSCAYLQTLHHKFQ